SFDFPRVQDHVDRQSVQPGSERALATKEMQLLPRPNEDILRQLFGAGTVADHASAEGEDPVHMLAVHTLERTPITSRRSRDVRIVFTGTIHGCFDDGHCGCHRPRERFVLATSWTAPGDGRFERGCMGTNPSSRSNVRRSVRRGEQGREFGNPFEPNTWRSRLEVLPLEGAPESGEGSNAGRTSGQAGGPGGGDT